MALDIAGFVTPEQTFPGLDKLGESMALAAKQKDADKKAKQAGVKYLQSTIYGKYQPVKDPESVLSEAIKNTQDNRVTDIYERSYNRIQNGEDPYIVSADSRNELLGLNTDINKINEAGNVYKNKIEEPNKGKKGFNSLAARQNFSNALNYVTDEEGNRIEASTSDVIRAMNGPDIIADAFNPRIKGYQDVWNKAAVTETVKEAKPVTETTGFTKIGPTGSSTQTTNSTTLPSQYYDLVYDKNTKDYNLNPKGDDAAISEEYTPLYQEALGDKKLDKNVQVVSDDIYKALNNNEVAEYLNQEAAKFEMKAINAGINTRDVNTKELLPEYKNQEDQFKKAILFKVMDEDAANQGYKKVNENLQKAAQVSTSTADKKESDDRDRDALYGSFNSYWDNRPSNEYHINIQPQVAGFSDKAGNNYSDKKYVYLFRTKDAPGNWRVNTYKKNRVTGQWDVDQSMTLKQFRSGTKSQDAEQHRKQHNYIEDWTKIRDEADYPKNKKKTTTTSSDEGWAD